MTAGSGADADADPLSSTRRALARRGRTRAAVLCVAAALTLGLAWAGVVHGVTDIDSTRLAATLLPGGHRVGQPLDWGEWTALVQLRLPRIATAVVAGAGLAWCGAGMQIITQNPMASPFTTGVSNAAAFGASTAMVASVSVLGSTTLGVVGGAFLAAAVCSAVVVGLAAATRMGAVTLVLTGVALSYLFGALGAALQYAADELQLARIVSWTFGDLGRPTWVQVGSMAAVVALGGAYVLVRSGAYRRLALGDEVALSLGVPVRRIRAETGMVVTLVAATVISFTGVIGFVGLVAPHIAGMLVGADERVRLPLAALVGASVLLAADLVGRLVLSPVIVPVGIVVSLVGVPVFLWLILREGRRSPA